MRVITTILALAFLVLLLATLRRQAPLLEIQNDSDRAVSSVEVEVAGQRADLSGVASGQSRWQHLDLHADGPLKVRVEFEGGEVVSGEGGYLTPGMRGANRLRIDGPDSVTIIAR